MSEHKKKTALTSTRMAAQRYQIELDTVKTQLVASEKTRNEVEQRILDMELQRDVIIMDVLEDVHKVQVYHVVVKSIQLLIV